MDHLRQKVPKGRPKTCGALFTNCICKEQEVFESIKGVTDLEWVNLGNLKKEKKRKAVSEILMKREHSNIYLSEKNISLS